MPFGINLGRRSAGGMSRGSGCGGRAAIAVVIAIIGIVTYFMRTETNPVTGEKQRVAMNVDQEKALGLELNATGFGMGIRGQRFAIYVDNGVVKGLHVEGPGEFKVSSAEHVLSTL